MPAKQYCMTCRSYIGALDLDLPKGARFTFDGTTLTYKGQKYTGAGQGDSFNPVSASLADMFVHAGWAVLVKPKKPASRLPGIVKRLRKMRDAHPGKSDHDVYLDALEAWDETLFRAAERLPVHQKTLDKALALLRLVESRQGLESDRLRKVRRFLAKHGGTDAGR